jgi:DNA-binding MarR family transcriptional regulator
MSERDDNYDQVEQHLALLFRRARAFSSLAAKAVHAELEPESYGLLMRIHELQHVRAADLADYFGVGRPTISRQVAALEKLELVERAPDQKDGRSFLISLTAMGRERLQDVRSSSRQKFRDALDGWDEQEVSQLAGALQRLNQAHFWK